MNTMNPPERCWVCCRVVGGRGGIRGSSRLRYSARLVAQALHDLTHREPLLSDRLCFRCYRLVLGMDQHSHQLERQQRTFFTIYRQAHPPSITTSSVNPLLSDIRISKPASLDLNPSHTSGITPASTLYHSSSDVQISEASSRNLNLPTHNIDHGLNEIGISKPASLHLNASGSPGIMSASNINHSLGGVVISKPTSLDLNLPTCSVNRGLSDLRISKASPSLSLRTQSHSRSLNDNMSSKTGSVDLSLPTHGIDHGLGDIGISKPASLDLNLPTCSTNQGLNDDRITKPSSIDLNLRSISHSLNDIGIIKTVSPYLNPSMHSLDHSLNYVKICKTSSLDMNLSSADHAMTQSIMCHELFDTSDHSSVSVIPHMNASNVRTVCGSSNMSPPKSFLHMNLTGSSIGTVCMGNNISSSESSLHMSVASMESNIGTVDMGSNSTSKSSLYVNSVNMGSNIGTVDINSNVSPPAVCQPPIPLSSVKHYSENTILSFSSMAGFVGTRDMGSNNNISSSKSSLPQKTVSSTPHYSENTNTINTVRLGSVSGIDRREKSKQGTHTDLFNIGSKYGPSYIDTLCDSDVGRISDDIITKNYLDSSLDTSNKVVVLGVDRQERRGNEIVARNYPESSLDSSNKVVELGRANQERTSNEIVTKKYLHSSLDSSKKVVVSGVENQEKYDIPLDAVKSETSKEAEASTVMITERNHDAEVNRAPLVPSAISSSPRRRKKIAKKWDDFDYYEEDGKDGDDNESSPTLAILQQCLCLNVARKRRAIACVTCKREFSTKREFLKHSCQQNKKQRRMGKVVYTCKGCQVNFPIRRDYIKHIDTCYKNIPVTCSFCQVKLPSAAYLPRHLNSYHKGSALIKKNSLCDQCGRGFSRKESLERHQAMAHGVSYGSHQCPQCGRTFPHTAILAEHLRAHRGYPCAECPTKRVFSCMSNLLLHRRTHHPNSTTPSARQAISHRFRCQSCNKKWKYHASYTYHMRKFHSGERTNEEVHRCGDCKLPLASRKALLKHAQLCSSSAQKNSGQAATTSSPVNPTLRSGRKSSRSLSAESEVEKSTEKTGLPTAPLTARTGNRSSRRQAMTREAGTGISGRIQDQVPHGSEAKEMSETSEISETEQVPLIPGPLTSSPSASPSLSSPSFSHHHQAFLPPASEIVLEALDDLSGDCQFVILVEDCLAEEK